MQKATATCIVLVHAVERPQVPGGVGMGRARWTSGQRVQHPVPRTLDPSSGSLAQRIICTRWLAAHILALLLRLWEPGQVDSPVGQG